MLSALLAIGQSSAVFAYPAFSNDAKDEAKSSQPAKNTSNSSPESDSRSASDTVWSVNSQIEKKLEQDMSNPKPQQEKGSLNSVLDEMSRAAAAQKNNSSSSNTNPSANPTGSTSNSGAASSTAGAASPRTSGTAGSNTAVTSGSSTSAERSNQSPPGASTNGAQATTNTGDATHSLVQSGAGSTPLGSEVSGASRGDKASGTDLIKIQQTASTSSPSTQAGASMPMPGLGLKGSKESPKLFGRIEQLAVDGDVKLPSLKMQTAQLDLRGKLTQRELEKYSGTIAKSFPTEFKGIWGGTLFVWSYRYSPDYLKEDRAEAVQTAQILKPGRSGAVNFQFYRNRLNQIALEPAKILLSVPLKDTGSFSRIMGGSSGMESQMGPFAGAFSQVMGNMEAPAVMLYFGTAATSDMEKGVSGNEFRQVTVKNVIRELGPGVMEQQIVTKSLTKVVSTGKTNAGYIESVLRFKRLSDTKLYVLAASVNYSGAGKYLSKLIMYGTVDKNQVAQTNPYANMQNMMGQMMNLGGMQQIFGGAGAKNGTVNVPHGGFEMQVPSADGFPMPGGGGFPIQVPGAGGFPMPGGGQSSGGFDPNVLMRQMQQQMQH